MKKILLILVVALIIIIGLFLIITGDIINGFNIAFKSLNFKDVDGKQRLSLGIKLINNSSFKINVKDVKATIYSGENLSVVSSDFGDIEIKPRQTKIIYIAFKDLQFENVDVLDLINMNVKGYYSVITGKICGRKLSSGKIYFE